MEGVPLKLLLAVLLLSLIVPASFNALASWDQQNTRQQLISELQLLAADIRQVHLSGPGAVRYHELDAEDGMFTDIVAIELGDFPGGEMCNVLKFELDDGRDTVLLLNEPYIPVTGGRSGLAFGPGEWLIRISVTILGSEQYVLLELVS